MRQRKKTYFLLALMLLIGWVACRKPQDLPNISPPYVLNIPEGFDAPIIPEDNALTIARVALGKKLFYDPILSRDSSVSCGSCHLLELAFTDGLPVSKGIENRLGFRNSPSLANMAYHPYFFREGGVPTLERQVNAPIEDETEMDFTVYDAVVRLQEHEEYPALIKEAYDREVDAFSLSRALAAFQRTLISGNSSFDQYFYQGDTNAMSSQAVRGMELFFSDALACSSCHSGFNFTNYAFENTGIYEVYEDPGRARFTNVEADWGKMKVPSLRNVAQTAPYMHDGSFETLDDVLEHYITGGQVHPNKSDKVKPLVLSTTEKEEIIAFLEALTDWEFLTNPLFN